MAPFDQALPALVIPAIVGLFILLKFRTDRTARAIGWYTFKPVIATPLWAVLVMASAFFPLGWIPGATLTVFLWTRYKSVLKPMGTSCYWLLLLDVARWVISGVILPMSMGRGPFLVLALGLPTVFALFGLALVLKPAIKANLRRSTDWRTRPHAKWVFGLSWLLATSVGFTIGNWWDDQLWQVPLFGPLLTGTIAGLVLGVAQWLVLRRELDRSLVWIALTTLGGAASALLLNTIYNSGLVNALAWSSSFMLVVGLIWGCLIGAAQWIGLRQYIPRVSSWVWANAIGWMLAIGSGILIETTSSNLGLILSLRGIIIGAITAAAAIRIFGRESSVVMPTVAESEHIREETEAIQAATPPRQPGYFATHRALLLAILIIGGAVVWLVAGLWPWANDAGYLTTWERISQAPPEATAIVTYTNYALYLKADNGTLYRCTLGRDSTCVIGDPSESESSYTNTGSCSDSGAEYSPFSGRPQSVLSCLQVQSMHFPGGRTVYLLDQSGGLWQWHYANSLLGTAFPLWAIGLLLGVIAVSAMIWTNATKK